MDRRFGPNFKRGKRDPRAANLVLILKGEVRDLRTADLVLFFKEESMDQRTADLILIFKGELRHHGPPIQSAFLQGG